ncbi:MAG: bifunctional phosphoglucose/phosphomannose isomerase, partial [Thermoplasmata archaeon]
MISLMYIGDFVSIYLALLRKVDPTPVDIITELKTELAR